MSGNARIVRLAHSKPKLTSMKAATWQRPVLDRDPKNSSTFSSKARLAEPGRNLKRLCTACAFANQGPTVAPFASDERGTLAALPKRRGNSGSHSGGTASSTNCARAPVELPLARNFERASLSRASTLRLSQGASMAGRAQTSSKWYTASSCETLSLLITCCSTSVASCRKSARRILPPWDEKIRTFGRSTVGKRLMDVS
mmetsp:Transcript_138586/g.276281  ORF Transcript_138586/g.276281 Transcript_138586/m.276281 type:complete len:200 (+) Transcript_138586:5321-5920(+)